MMEYVIMSNLIDDKFIKLDLISIFSRGYDFMSINSYGSQHRNVISFIFYS